MAKQLVLVLGMGRSGTSAMTRIVSLCGAGLSEQLLGANPSNPRGHWESAEAMEINRAFMSRFATSWHDPSFDLQKDCALQPDVIEEFENAIGAYLTAAFETTDVFVVKDPRISAMAPHWLRTAARVDCEIKVIHMFRRLEGVAHSLAKRDGVVPNLSKALWLKYHLQCERDCRNQKRVFVEFPDFLLTWHETIPRLFGSLQVDLHTTPEATAAIEEFVDRTRAPEPSPEERTNLTDLWVETVYEWMRSAATNAQPNPAILDRCFSDVTSVEGMYRASFGQYWANRGRWY